MDAKAARQRAKDAMAVRQQAEDAKIARRQTEDALAQDIIEEARVQLMLKFRFLDRALWRMELVPLRVGAAYPLATDGSQVVFDPPRVIARFQASDTEMVRDYLHMVMHCIFRQPFDKHHDEHQVWDLTCDIIVENAIMEMCGGRFPSEDDEARKQVISEIRMLAGSLMPGRVYAFIKGMVETPYGQQYRGLGRSVLNEWRALFERDDHGAWPANNTNRDTDAQEDQGEGASEDPEGEEPAPEGVRAENPGDTAPEQVNAQEVRESSAGEEGAEGTPGEEHAQSEDGAQDEDSTRGEGDATGTHDETAAESAQDEPDAESAQDAQNEESAESAEQPHETNVTAEGEWEEIARQIEMNLETFSKEWGAAAGSLMAHLAFVNRRRFSYTELLQRFATPTEDMRVNMDEFDYIYYTYGMDTYGNIPLIEPLEYKETQRVRDFVIVVDTSESVKGELVTRFIEHTLGILKGTEDFAHQVNIHVIQADSRVQSDMHITNLSDLAALSSADSDSGSAVSGFTLRGFGGTDFRPAFDYVETLRNRGQLTDLKGLIYFTDGLGQFPERPPDYDAVFVFVEEEGVEPPPVPPWAIKFILGDDDW